MELVSQWQRLEGVILLSDNNEFDFENYLKELNVLACVSWDSSYKNAINIAVMVNEGQVAGYCEDQTIKPVYSLSDFVDKLAVASHSFVDFGENYADYSEEEITVDGEIVFDDSEVLDSRDEQNLSTSVLITQTPATVFPFLSNIGDTDLGVLELGDGKRAVFQTAKSTLEIDIVEVAEEPYLAFYQEDYQFYFVYVPNSKFEDSISYSWNENVRFVYGSLATVTDNVKKIVRAILSPYSIDTVIASISPNVELSNVSKALELPAVQGVALLMKEFGLPAEAVEFLSGSRALSQVPSVVTHEPRGYANAMERSFKLTDADGRSCFWRKYYNISLEKPWILNVIGGFVGFVGMLLLSNSIRSEKRTMKSVMTGILGILLMVEGVAEYMLNKYIGVKEELRRRDSNDW